jgi:hypothetical protein
VDAKQGERARDEPGVWLEYTKTTGIDGEGAVLVERVVGISSRGANGQGRFGGHGGLSHESQKLSIAR